MRSERIPLISIVVFLTLARPISCSKKHEATPPKADKIAHELTFQNDNVSAKDYPAMFVTTGLHDSQVQYFEPVKVGGQAARSKNRRQPHRS